MQYFIPCAICNQVVTTPLHAGYGLEYNDKDKFYGSAILAPCVRSSRWQLGALTKRTLLCKKVRMAEQLKKNIDG